LKKQVQRAQERVALTQKKSKKTKLRKREKPTAAWGKHHRRTKNGKGVKSKKKEKTPRKGARYVLPKNGRDVGGKRERAQHSFSQRGETAKCYGEEGAENVEKEGEGKRGGQLVRKRYRKKERAQQAKRKSRAVGLKRKNHDIVRSETSEKYRDSMTKERRRCS